MSIFIMAYQNRATTEEIDLLKANGDPITLAANDKVRVKIGRGQQLPLLDIVSGTNLGGGTSVTKANPAVLSLYPADLAAANIPPGVYDIEAIVIDSADSDRAKIADEGVFVLSGTMLGAIT